MRAITPDELTKLRSTPQNSQLYLAIPTPATLFKASLGALPAADNGSYYELPTTKISGGIANIVPDLTVLVTDSAEATIKGWCRVRIAPGAETSLPIGEISAGEIAFSVGDYIHVLDTFHIFPKHIRLVGKKNPVIYQDWNIAYSDQHASLDPVVNLGPDVVIWKPQGAAYVDVPFDASGSFVLGGSVSGYAWACPGVTISGPATATPSLRIASAGRYRVSCTVTSAAGKSFTGYRYVNMYDDAHPPITQVELGSCQGSWDSGGWSFTVRAYGELAQDQARDRAQVFLCGRDWYQNVEGSLGPLPGRENVIAMGWIVGSSINVHFEEGYTEFEVQGPQHWMTLCDSFPAGVEDTDFADNGGGNPSAWTQMLDLTTDKGVWHLLHWRSTLTRMLDVYLTGDAKQAAMIQAPDSTLWAQLLTMANGALLAQPCFDRYGRLFVQIEPNYCPLSERDAWPVALALQSDELEALSMQPRMVSGYSQVEVSGVWYQNKQYAPVGARSPGEIAAWTGTESLTLSELVLGNQAQALELAGLVAGSLAGPIETVDCVIANNNRFIDVAGRGYVQYTFRAEDNRRGFACANARLIPRQVSFDYDPESGQLACRVEFIGEGVQIGAVKMTFPGESEPPEQPPGEPPEPPPPPNEPPEPPPSPAGSGSAVAAVTGDIRLTQDLSEASPAWTSVAPPEGIIDADIPAGSPDILFALTESELWLTTQLSAGHEWVKVLQTSAWSAEISGLKFARVRAVGNMVYVLAYTPQANGGNVFLFRSSNQGLTWSYSLVAENVVSVIPYTVTVVEYSVTVSPPQPGVWTSAAVVKTVERKGDSGNSYNPWAWAFTSNTPQGNFSMLTDDTTLYQGPPTPYGNMEQVQDRHPGAVIGDVNKLLPVGSVREAALAMLNDYFGSENSGWFKFGLTDYGTLAFPLDPARTTLGIQANSPQGTTDTGVFWYFWHAPQDLHPSGFDAAPTNPNWLYLGLETSVLKSEDGGYTWETFTAAHGADDIRVHPMAAGCIAFWGDDGNLYQCVDGVIQPGLLAAGVRVRRPLRIAFDASGGALYALAPTDEDTFDLKKRALAVWSDLETGLAGARSIRCYPGAGGLNTLLYLSAANIRHSADGGATWADRKGSWGEYAQPVTIHLLRRPE